MVKSRSHMVAPEGTTLGVQSELHHCSAFSAHTGHGQHISTSFKMSILHTSNKCLVLKEFPRLQSHQVWIRGQASWQPHSVMGWNLEPVTVVHSKPQSPSRQSGDDDGSITIPTQSWDKINSQNIY